jgi:hypothetical protein
MMREINSMRFNDSGETMNDDTFVCKNCGDILRDPVIATYRAVISSGGSVSGAIRCGRCGYTYSADELAGVSYENSPKFHQESKENNRIVKNSFFLAVLIFFILYFFIFSGMKNSGDRLENAFWLAFVSFPIMIFIGIRFSKFFYNNFNTISNYMSYKILSFLRIVSNKILSFLRNRGSM